MTKKNTGIKVESDANLGLLFDRLAGETATASFCHELLNKLIDAKTIYEQEFAQSNTFWRIVAGSLNDVRVLCLCRVYDQNQKALSLRTLLMTIAANSNKTCYEHLAKQGRTPDVIQLEKDIRLVGSSNTLVSKLVKWRNNLIAHIGADAALGKTTPLGKNPLIEADIEMLLDRAFDILNRYRNLYGGGQYSRHVSGSGDYENLLKMVKRGIQKWNEDNP